MRIRFAKYALLEGLLLIGLLFACSGCGCPARPCGPVDASEVESFQRIVGFLADPGLGGRPVASAEGRQAGEWIAREMADAGLTPAGQSGGWFDTFEVDKRVLAAPQRPADLLCPTWRHIRGQGQNVVGCLRSTTGGGRTIVLGAHYDHLPATGEHARDFGHGLRPGANDNASGVAVLLMVARQLAQQPQRRFNYLFVAFDGEEFGFVGSRHFIQQRQVSRDSVACMICLDEVGQMRDGRLFVLGNVLRPRVARSIPRFEGEMKVTPIPIVSFWGWSDHSRFALRGTLTLFFYTGLHRDHHRRTDQADAVNVIGAARTADAVIRTVQGLDENLRDEPGVLQGF